VLKTEGTENMKSLKVHSRFAICKCKEMNMSVSFNTLCNLFLSHIVSCLCVSVIFLNNISNDNRSFRNIVMSEVLCFL